MWFVGAVLALFAIAEAQSGPWSTDVPFWPHYPLRQVQVLDGTWEYGYSATADPVSIMPSQISTPNFTYVPNAFDVTPPGVLGPRGTAFYRSSFPLTPNSEGMVYFAACSFYCRVFVDGNELGDHRAGGYQPFAFLIPPSQEEWRELLVVVNNQYNSTTAPTHTGGDFWMYGGITRNVLVHELPSSLFLQRVETFTVDLSGIINVNVVLGGQAYPDSINISLAFDSDDSGAYFVAPVVNGTASLTNVAVPNPTVWSMASPNLHTLTVTLSNGGVLDAITVRFGIRTIGVDQATSRFTMNGEIVKLHGVNRHTMWPDTGSALTLEQIQTDVAILQSMHVNYVRGAHYPQDQRFLDMLDEIGIVIWEEALGPGVTLQDLQSPYFLQYQVIAVNEMIDASINHPCIILQAFMNEGPSNQAAACPGYNVSAQVIRSRVGNPPTRFVTWANNQLTNDQCISIEDVISFNAYPAWYIEPGNLSYIVPFWQGEAAWALSHWPEKPFFISETGASGIFEWTNSSDPMWSQGFQKEVIRLDAGVAMNTSSISGLTLWQFADIKIEDSETIACGQCDYYPHLNLSVPWNCEYIKPAAGNCNRPGGENHKGQVDFWRRYKESYYVVQDVYGNVPNDGTM